MNINLADALVSILALQTALLDQFATPDTPTIVFNSLTGGGICIYAFVAGVYMIVKATKKLKTLDGSEKTADTQTIEAIREKDLTD